MFSSDVFAAHSKLHIPQSGQEKDRIVPCMVNYCHGKDLQIITQESLTPGQAVSVEHEDLLLLGAVIQSMAQAHLWRVQIQIEHALNGMMNLLVLRAKLMDESGAPAQKAR